MTHETFESLAALDALGAAMPEEHSDLHSHLCACPDCRSASDEFIVTAAMMGVQFDPVDPPDLVRPRILRLIGSRPSVRRWLWPAAAMLFLVLWGWREFAVRQQRDAIAHLQQNNQKLSSVIASLASRDTRTIALSGEEMSPSASARVFMEPSKRRALVFFQNMPVNPNDKSYQLWILRADQPKPQSAGTFDITSSGSASITIENLPVATEIKGLAVTLEPRGGVEQPTNLRFYVAGKT